MPRTASNDTIANLVTKADELRGRANTMAHVLGAFDRIDQMWGGKKVGGKQKVFFDTAINSFLRDLLILATSSLPPESAPIYDDDVRISQFVNGISS